MCIYNEKSSVMTTVAAEYRKGMHTERPGLLTAVPTAIAHIVSQNSKNKFSLHTCLSAFKGGINGTEATEAKRGEDERQGH